jgi:hypothetical protein
MTRKICIVKSPYSKLIVILILGILQYARQTLVKKLLKSPNAVEYDKDDLKEEIKPAFSSSFFNLQIELTLSLFLAV